jgi:hypothetical protein
MSSSYSWTALVGHSVFHCSIFVYNRIDSIRRCLRSAQHFIGRITVQEAFLHRIPLQDARHLHCNMGNQTNRACSMSDFNGRNRLFPTLDALQPVEVLFFTLVQMNFILSNDRTQNFRVACIQ